MIPLSLKIDPLPFGQIIIMRLNTRGNNENSSSHDAHLINKSDGKCEFDYNGISIFIHWDHPEEIDGDVIMINGSSTTARRLIRTRSGHNTLLITERCDQLCIMCSQPPKDTNYDFFEAYTVACMLAPQNATIGLSGGEPTLYKEKLFELITTVSETRPDIGFHVLTNAQHFTETDLEALRTINQQVLWGVPIYSPDTDTHDQIVGKAGAFKSLKNGLRILSLAGAQLELRTVIMRSNAPHLEALSHYIAVNVPHFSTWAIMQMENIGYGRKVWKSEFLDTSTDFSCVSKAIDLMLAKGRNVKLYNFPLCTVPDEYQPQCAISISDWKMKFLDKCSGCSQQKFCCGFFEWYKEEHGFSEISAYET
ncbi:His-Xaa-Ser system radical SAM maturase HxsC [Rhodobacterales bacterium FZCC0069]|nr:His-Xaa-Ser system radical SAM maturase HxsC [Rhodobacterales bacterium FZCC0069]